MVLLSSRKGFVTLHARSLYWRQVNVLTGHLRMKLLVWSFLLLLILCSNSEEQAVEKTRLPRWQSQRAKGQRTIHHLKRHSDGTFTSDFTNHLDKIKAKDFIEWLASIKRGGCRDEFLQTVADI